MSSLDPFGGPPSRPPMTAYGTHKPRKGGDGTGVWKNLEGTARDFGATVGSQVMGKGARGWNGANSILSAISILFGVVFLLLGVKIGDVVLLATAVAVGVGLVFMGGVGIVTTKKDITSIRTLHLTLAVVVGLLGCSYTNQVLITRQNDCILAETFMRLDHLESAMQQVRHDELISGIMMRLDHLNTDINHIKDHAEDKVEENRRQEEFKQLDAKYVEDKIRDLLNIAEDGLDAIEKQANELEANITILERQQEEEKNGEEKATSKSALKAKLRSLRYRQKTLGPKKDQITDIMRRLDSHLESPDGLKTEDYVDILTRLEKYITDKDIQKDIADEKGELTYVKSSTGRLEKNVYDQLIVGDFQERNQNRTTVRDKQKKQYEKFMANIYKKHENKFVSKERYLQSLNSWLESMPEHCMQDLDNAWLSSALGWGSVSLAIVTGYVALTATVVSGKKDF